MSLHLLPTSNEARTPIFTDIFRSQQDSSPSSLSIVGARTDVTSSIRGIQRLIEHFYGRQAGYGTVWNTVHEAEERAQQWLKEQDLGNIKRLVLDELFSQGYPVLAAMDLESEYLFLLEVTDDRKGSTWAEKLDASTAQGLSPDRQVAIQARDSSLD